MSTLSEQQVGDLMSIYAARPCPVNEAIPRHSNSGVTLFDRGHFRRLIASSRFVQNGTLYTIIKGEKIELVNLGQGLYIPFGFHPVPVRTVLKYFATDALVNAFKMENAILDYKRAYDAWLRDQPRRNPKPRRPTLRQLKLGRGSEFENYLKPLILGYSERLKESFDYCLDLVEQNKDVFTHINDLYLPNTDNNGNKFDSQKKQRWDDALNIANEHKYIYVRMDNFTGLTSVPSVRDPVPQGLAPFPPAPQSSGGGGGGGAPPGPSFKEQDEKLLGVNDKYGGAFKNDFLRMTPWESAQRTANPLKSPEYRYAWALVQHGFEVRYAAFKSKMDRKRLDHAAQWAMYKAYRDAQEAYPYTGVPAVIFAERPQVEDFNLEWKEFIFGSFI